MATDWGNEENSSRALARIANILDESANSTADDEDLRFVQSDDSDHITGSNHELDSGSGGGSVSESLTVPGRPDEVRIVVQNASGNYSVDLSYDNTTIAVQDAASTDLNAQEPVASNTTVDVTISDDSGASNTVDYDILLR